MSFHRFVHVAGWAAVILLAIVGFAAFNAGGGPSATAPLSLVEPVDAAPVDGAGGALAEGALGDAAGAGDPAPTVAASTSEVELDTGWLDSVTFRELVSAHFVSSDVNQAVRLAWCLSRFDVDTIDPATGAVGLFQIAPSDWAAAISEMGLPADADPFDPATNVAVAAHLVYSGPGWLYWSCS